MRNLTVISILGLLAASSFAENCWTDELGKKKKNKNNKNNNI